MVSIAGPDRNAPLEAARPARRIGWRASASGAAVVALEHPGTWPIALCGFLVRGGIVLFLLPLVSLPSPIGLANLIGPTSVTAAGLTPEATLRLVAILGSTVTLMLAGIVIGAGCDASIARALPASEPFVDASVERSASGRRPITVGLIARLAGLRLVALIPVSLAIAASARPIGEAVYDELILPRDFVTPLAWRVFGAALAPIALVLAGWQIGEIVGGIATIRVVELGEPVLTALRRSVRHAVRHPASTLAPAVVGLVLVAIAIGPALIASGVSLAGLEARLVVGTDPVAIGVSIALFVSVWAGGLVLGSVVLAWRQLAWRQLAWAAEVAPTATRVAVSASPDPDVRPRPD